MHEPQLEISFKLIHPDAVAPTKKHFSDAGYDLTLVEPIEIYPMANSNTPKNVWTRALAPTWVCVSIPQWYYGRIAPRSWLAAKHGIDVLAGVIDSWYIWEIKVILVNFGDDVIYFEPGDRIAQLIIEKCHDVNRNEVQWDLQFAERWVNWFGSTGV